MSYTWTIRDGATEPVLFNLLDGSSAYNLTGIQALELRLVPRAGGATKSYTTVSGEVAVTDAAAGEVTFSPGSSDLAYSDAGYEAYFWVTDGDGKKISFPSDRSFGITMIEAP